MSMSGIKHAFLIHLINNLLAFEKILMSTGAFEPIIQVKDWPLLFEF